MIDNKFYVAKDSENHSVFEGYTCASGTPVYTGNNKICSMLYPINVKKFGRIFINIPYKNVISTNYYWLDAGSNVVKSESTDLLKIDSEIPINAYSFIAEFVFATNQRGLDDFTYMLYKPVIPHYKSLKKQYKKENGQMFFRETLDGKINLFGDDYEYIKTCSVNDKLVFDIYQDGKKYITTTFNKTDCKFDHFKKSVELKLTANDAYTDILNKYNANYDIIKLAPARNWLTLTKRCIIQIYIQGEKVISNYAGGTYWETDVDEPIDSSDALINKYYFSKGQAFKEINLSGFNYDINTSYSCIRTKDCWNSNSYIEVGGTKYEMPCSIKFTKVYSEGDTCEISERSYVRCMTNPGELAASQDTGEVYYDTYRIEIYTGANGTGAKIYRSVFLYGLNDTNAGFDISQKGSGSDWDYKMTRIEQPAPLKNPEPATFNLNNSIIEYNTWARLLCDIDKLDDDTKLYDLPYDDFATARENYKKCIGLTGFDSNNSIIHLLQNTAESEEPTSFGINDFGKYFQSPYLEFGSESTVFPLARSSWGNTALWTELRTANFDAANAYEKWCKKYYKQYTIKDCYSVGNVIKALLKKIDSNIKHETTEEYSQFLYGQNTVATSDALNKCKLYITQKTNILKGEYDQAAQKAEISLKDILDMLRDCFRCYWYIDSNNKFIIEHASYFINGFSYGNANIGIDCTKLTDKFNKKNVQYCQHEIDYDKSDLQSRYEFDWADKSTDSMSNLTIDVLSEYVQKDNIESIAPNKFSVDVDYMLFMPSDFSKDGFALLAADEKGIVPISQSWVIRDNRQDITKMVVTPQNYILSWNKLINHYMLDMPGNYIKYNNLVENSLNVQGTRKCMKHKIVLQPTDKDPDVTKTVKTLFGNGYIESVLSNIDTRLVTIELSYVPV